MNNQRGSVMVFVTLMIVLLMIMVGMGLDTGGLSFSRATGQGAVDAAALSAVTALPAARAANDSTLVENRASEAYLSANNYTGSSTNPITGTNVSYVQYDFNTNKITNYGVALGLANGVRVAMESGTAMKSPAFLTPLFKLFGASASGSNNVSVSAVSVINARPSIPIAIWSTQCSGSATVPDLKIRVQPPGSENSCWTTYLDKSSGADDIRELFQASGSCKNLPIGPIDIGIPIYENKGTAATIYEDASNLFLTNPNTKDRCWIIPVINPPTGGNCNEKNPAPIVDWAEICPTVVDKGGSSSYIQASLTCNKTLKESSASVCFSNRLVREHAKGM